MPRKPTYEELEQKVKELENEVAQLNFSEGQLSEAISQSLIPTVIGGSDGSIISFNEVLEELIGYRRSEISDVIDWSNKLYPDKEYRDFVSNNIQQALRGEKQDCTEFTITRKDGSIRTVDFYTSFFKDGLIIQMVDISRSKQAEKTLRESEVRYRELFDNISSGVAIYEVRDNGNDFIFKDFNKAGERLDGDHRENLVGKSIYEVRSGIEEFGLLDVFRRVWKTGVSEHFPAKQYQDEQLQKWYENFVYRLPTGELVTVFDNITERRRSEEALWVNEERLRVTNERLEFAMDAGEHGFWDWNIDTNEVFFSPRYYTMLGYENEEFPMVLETWINLMHPEDRETIVPQIQKHVENAEPYESEFRLKCKDGSWRWISGRGKSYDLDENDVSHRAVGLHVDITERKQAEEALRESENKYRTFLETTSEGCWMLNPEVKTIEVNAALCKMLGYSQDELLGKTPFDFVDDENRKVFIEQTSKISDTEHRSYEIVLKKRNGEDLHTYFNATTIRAESGEVLGSFALITDITDRKRAEDALRASEARYRSMMEAMTDPTYICSHDFRIEYMNSAMIEKVGRDVTGEICHKAIYDEDEKCSWCVFDQILQGKNKTYERYDPETGRYYFINCSPVAHSDAPTSKLSIFRNISEIKKMEKARIATEIQLQQAQKMESVGCLAGGVAHDYNNALSVIIGFTEMVINDVNLTGSLRDDLGEVLKAANRATDITRQLLAFARKQTIQPKVLDLNKNVKGMLKMLQRLIGENIDFAWLPGTSLWPVKMDPSQIDQILANLCVNARDAIEDVGKVTIETGTVVFDTAYCADHIGFVPGEFVKLAVSDNGCGMDKEILDKIFEPFFTTKDVDKGTGLGLATVYGIVKQNNGFINVYSEPGKGTTIKIYLPRHEGKVDECQVEITAKIPQGQGETILVVEDDLSILKLAQKILDVLGYTVLIANTPGEAMGLAEEHAGKIHLLVTDVVMPELNGRDLAEQLKSLYPGLKCLFMSGYTADAIARHGVLEEGVNFIQKSFSKKDLAVKVRAALGDRD